MASKKYKGLSCVYCNATSSASADHVFAREFFSLNERENLPKVPACISCNSEKSKLEHYLTAVLPFGGRHRSAEEQLREQVPRRLANNDQLRNHLDTQKREVALDGETVRRLAIPIDSSMIERYFAFVVKGLVWHHWNVRLSDNDEIEVIQLTEAGERFFQENFFSKLWRKRREETSRMELSAMKACKYSIPRK